MLATTALRLPLAAFGGDRRPPSRLQAHAAIAAASFVAFILGRLLGGPLATLFTVAGVGACGWAWLLTRALFDDAPHDALWPRIVATIIQLTGALATLAPDGAVSTIADNAYALSGSAALMLTFVEPLHDFRRDLSRPERRFRVIFLAAYTGLIAASILAPRPETGPGAVDLNNLIKAACAVVGLVAVGLAVRVRLRHPLVRSEAAAKPARREPTAEDQRLAERLLDLLHKDQIDLEPELRIGDVARRLREPEHKVSQCISAALGFPNFNRLINHHRIARAKRLLADTDNERSILDVAFDCGFASLGPFNRAFKAEVGMTPRAFRAAARP